MMAKIIHKHDFLWLHSESIKSRHPLSDADYTCIPPLYSSMDQRNMTESILLDFHLRIVRNK